jgi:hypothetical protein
MTNGINVEQTYFLMNIQHMHANGVGREKNNIKRKPKNLEKCNLSLYRLGYGLVVLIKTKLTKSLILAAKA